MRKMKRVLCLILAVVLVFGSIITAEAAEAEAQASYYLSSYLAYIYPEGDGKISVWFEVHATGTMDEVGAITIRLREKAPGATSWTSVKTYFYDDYPEMLGSDVNHYYGHVDYEGTPGYTYFAYVTVWAGDDGDGDSRILATAEVVAT